RRLAIGQKDVGANFLVNKVDTENEIHQELHHHVEHWSQREIRIDVVSNRRRPAAHRESVLRNSRMEDGGLRMEREATCWVNSRFSILCPRSSIFDAPSSILVLQTGFAVGMTPVPRASTDDGAEADFLEL